MQLLHERGGNRTYWGRAWSSIMTGPMYALRWVSPHTSHHIIVFLVPLQTRLVLHPAFISLPEYTFPSLNIHFPT